MGISIVTAFFDIGRGDWSVDNGHPHYLKRTNETYLERFSHLAKLENEMVIFTSYEFVDVISKMREGKKTTIVPFDYRQQFNEILNRISEVQNDENFKKLINPSQISNPEYWNSSYVLINALKAFFVRLSIEKQLVTNNLVSWIDFGYCRSEDTLNNIKEWDYSFDEEKIHFFNIKDCDNIQPESDTINIISNNDVHITGPCIVAPQKLWPLLEQSVSNILIQLLNNNVVDDDQTLLLLSYHFNKDVCELHKISDNDWFVIFKEFSNG